MEQLLKNASFDKSLKKLAFECYEQGGVDFAETLTETMQSMVGLGYEDMNLEDLIDIITSLKEKIADTVDIEVSEVQRKEGITGTQFSLKEVKPEEEKVESADLDQAAPSKTDKLH